MRPTAPIAAALIAALGLSTGAHAQQSTLPDIGSSAGELLSPQEEIEYGAFTLYQLRRYGYVLEDPLIDGWLDNMGHRLAAASDRPEQHFVFFMMRSRQINAFATLGGYVGINAGLILTARNEDEVAGVVAHEVSHVTQRHVLRAVERAKKDQLPILLATLGAVIAAQQSNSRDAYGNKNNGDAIQAALISGQALAIQRQINYTRSSEAEADRVGIQTLYQAGYDPDGMADFFERMSTATRGNAGGFVLPDYLLTHPVSTTRTSEARDRSSRLKREKPGYTSTGASQGSFADTSTSIMQSNPLLPWGLVTDGPTTGSGPQRMFSWAKERLRALTAETPAAGLKEAQAVIDSKGTRASDPERYGLALSQMQVGYPAAAETGLQALAKKHPENLWVGLALAENAYIARDAALARKRYEELLARRPDDRAISLSYAETLNNMGTADAGKRAQEVLRPILAANLENPLFQKNYGRASELAGDLPRAGEAFAEAAYLNGRAEDALNQLNALLKRNDLGYIQRARIESRIAAITPEVLYMQKQKIKPQDLPADPS